ncbi:exosortase/archaeosortase family protein [Cerasicoccus arenae]|uniref:Methanolan biosynthesis EpsI domain-containing protein n=1 Tax=Cerasicoccus arenae TaxID=424488 RepID=A0A8J3GCY6_9BACT|nr:exosortase/archaeosortase family protein [Cerasicoccus arenae]MBK1857025.1 exosortase/archaeosortase family protein [Cerasicoccus arenae]GHB91932.1 hypothetical protein GCM10007047_03570 [Cerasicoccus arenae]
MSTATLKIWLLPLLLQFAFYYQICGFWDPDSHYFFGWGVPVLSLFLFWTRAEDEPPRSLPTFGWLIPAMFFLGLFAIIRVLWETMSTWHMLSWSEGLCLAAFGIFWGMAWGGVRWSRHYLFPLVFFLTSIPWPGRIEMAVSDWLTGHIANFVTVSLQMLGIPAMLQGIQISIGDAVVEVAEACSGIRSLQFLLVTTLFLGEYGQLSMPRRIALLIAGMCASFVQNAIRALALGWITGIEGSEAYDRWHDNTGAITFVFGLGVVFIAFLIIEPKNNKSAKPAAKPSTFPVSRWCSILSMLALLAYGGVEFFRWQWYNMPELNNGDHWEIDPTQLSKLPAHRTLKVDPLVKTLYETEDVYSGQFLVGESLVNYFFITWTDGYPVMRANAHTPEVCMGTVEGMLTTKPREVHMLQQPWDDTEYESYEFQHPISSERIAVYRSLMLPVSTQKYNQFYLQASSGWFDKLKMSYRNFWDRIDENSMVTRQLLLIGVTSPSSTNEEDTLYRFIHEALNKDEAR